MRARRRWSPFGAMIALALAGSVVFLVLPVLAVFVDVSPRQLLRALQEPSAREALALSLETSLIAVAVVAVVGTPAAYALSARAFRGRTMLVTLLELPLVLPPAVAGIALLAALGPQGLLGGALRDVGIGLVFQKAGVVVALVFVSAPFHLRQAQASFAAVDRSWLDASRTLGSGPAATFARVAVRAAAPGLTAGLGLAWARALGEFGATLLFAGSFSGVTQTAPLAIYERFGSDFTGALALSAVLVVASAAVLIGVKLLGGRRD